MKFLVKKVDGRHPPYTTLKLSQKLEVPLEQIRAFLERKLNESPDFHGKMLAIARSLETIQEEVTPESVSVHMGDIGANIGSNFVVDTCFSLNRRVPTQLLVSIRVATPHYRKFAFCYFSIEAET